jgi:hypothetical protein
MVMVYLVMSVGKFEPVNVTGVPPTTVPNLGEIARRFVVSSP